MNIIIILLLTWLGVQFGKFIYRSSSQKRYTWRNFSDDGGMPSAHAALVSALTTLVYVEQGVKSPLFAVAFIFSLIIIRDAFGLRQTVGNQSKALNQIQKELKLSYKELNEQQGHRFIEVLVGILFGVATALILNYLLF